MPTQSVAFQQTYISGGVTYSTTMYSSAFGTYGPARGKKWYECHVCGFSYPEDRVVLRGGVAFCRENMCYLDMDKRRTQDY